MEYEWVWEAKVKGNKTESRYKIGRTIEEDERGK
jgi:hypothetical protein